MKWLRSIKNKSWYVKTTQWEYWPSFYFNIPVVFIWLFFSIRARSLFFFTRVNPAIETGGVFTESKINIFEHLPSNVIPATHFLPANKVSEQAVLHAMHEMQIDFPIILKPNIGERGTRVEIMRSAADISAYLSTGDFDLIIQDFVTYTNEMSVVYHRFPENDSGSITSVCIKDPLSVTGNGESTLGQLMMNKPRARFQYDRLLEAGNLDFNEVIPNGETRLLELIGNHCRGTTFLDGNHHIDQDLISVFDGIHHQMKGMWYGRFDLKYETVPELKEGKNFKIVEFNGVSSEPAHIYDPRHSIWFAYREIYRHWKIIYTLSVNLRKRGVRNTMTLRDAINAFRIFYANKRALKLRK